MFNTTKSILSFSRNTLTIAVVKLHPTPVIVKQTQVKWTKENLSETLQVIASKSKIHHYAILLEDDISYTLNFSLNVPKKGIKVRDLVFEYLQKNIPETLDTTHWDFKDMKKGTKLEVVAFAPVFSVFSDISDALHAADITPEFIETESVAKTRNQNSFVGTAMKNDIRGNDEVALNIQLLPKKIVPVQKKTEVQSSVKPITKKVKTPLVRRSYLYMLLLTLMLSAFSLYLVKIFQVPEPTNLLIPQPMYENKEATSAGVLLSPSEFSVQILNGSAKTGQAKVVEELLKKEMFTNTATGTNKNIDPGAITIRVKEGTQSALLDQKIRGMFSEITPITTETLQLDSKYDVVIVIGRQYAK